MHRLAQLRCDLALKARLEALHLGRARGDSDELVDPVSECSRHRPVPAAAGMRHRMAPYIQFVGDGLDGCPTAVERELDSADITDLRLEPERVPASTEPDPADEAPELGAGADVERVV